jgi:anti-sigma factor RsiW
MSHPEDLLAEYVDGALADRDRAAVDAHLAGCDRCREEISLARASRASLRELPEVHAPVGSASRALREAGSPGTGLSRTGVAAAARPPRLARWIPAAAAAALIGLLVLTVPRLGDHATTPASSGQNPFDAGEKATGASGAAAPSAAAVSSGDAQKALDQLLGAGVRLEHRDHNYTAADIRQLTDVNGARYLGAAVPGSPTASDSGAAFAPLTRGHEAKAAIACISSQVTTSPTDALVELIEAGYEGAPAFFAVLVESPAPGDPVNEVIVWAVRKDGCTIANFAFRKL